jgi:hypothetical protein
MSLPSSIAFLPRMSRWLSDSYASPGIALSIHFDPGGRTHTLPWCSTCELPGRISAATTHMSSLKSVFTSTYL